MAKKDENTKDSGYAELIGIDKNDKLINTWCCTDLDRFIGNKIRKAFGKIDNKVVMMSSEEWDDAFEIILKEFFELDEARWKKRDQKKNDKQKKSRKSSKQAS